MKVGLLPLYIALYDVTSPHVRPRLEAFYQTIAGEIEKRGIQVVTSDFCRLKPEFEKAVADFEANEVDAIVTLHMAYSPSLESIDALTETKLPLIVLDTTETLEFSPEQSAGEIMYNHGIHGVMDLCSMLKRRGKPYAIAAGHYRESDCVERVCGFVRAAVAAKALGQAKVGLIGGGFAGMGDFAVPAEELKEAFGITIENLEANILDGYMEAVTKDTFMKELQADDERFTFAEDVNMDDYKEVVKTGLALRECLKDQAYTAFSVNFTQVENMPFIECCKAMERGIGYAGEGDGLTAAFAGALLTSYPETGFVEIFCPDWKNNLIFLSHMGEINYRIADGKPLVCPKKNSKNYMGYGRMKGGKGVYVNVSRGYEGFDLLISEAEILSVKEENFERSIRGWLKPTGNTTAEFLEKHSKYGATHHSIFVYNTTMEEMEYFGKLLSMNVIAI